MATAADGVATFSGLTLNNVDSSHTLRAAANGLTPVLTAPHQRDRTGHGDQSDDDWSAARQHDGRQVLWPYRGGRGRLRHRRYDLQRQRDFEGEQQRRHQRDVERNCHLHGGQRCGDVFRADSWPGRLLVFP
jgi:hypothetical protein